jgi:GxxExxY protein
MNTDKSGLLKAMFEEENQRLIELPPEINKITEKIIGGAYKVSNTLGCGFLEKVYENAFAYELKKIGFKVLQQHSIKVYYEEIVVGKYLADLFVEDCVIVEIKAHKNLEKATSRSV